MVVGAFCESTANGVAPSHRWSNTAHRKDTRVGSRTIAAPGAPPGLVRSGRKTVSRS